MNEPQTPQREFIGDALKKYKETPPNEITNQNSVVGIGIPKPTQFNSADFEKTMSKETDPDLMTSYEIVKLPSKGILYQHGISEVAVEYMTSQDEDLLTTPSLIESGVVLDRLLKRKIKTQGIVVEDLLSGDRDAIILYLRTSSYGTDYSVKVTDPRNGTQFPAVVDLRKLKYKELTESPDEQGYFTVFIPMRKKVVKFRLLTSGEDNKIFKKAEGIKEAYGEEFSRYGTLKLKASIIAIDEKTDRSYIDKFVDAMPGLDTMTIRKKILEVSPEVDMSYEFTTKDDYKFTSKLSVGIDFFFPDI